MFTNIEDIIRDGNSRENNVAIKITPCQQWKVSNIKIYVEEKQKYPGMCNSSGQNSYKDDDSKLYRKTKTFILILRNIWANSDL